MIKQEIIDNLKSKDQSVRNDAIQSFKDEIKDFVFRTTLPLLKEEELKSSRSTFLFCLVDLGIDCSSITEMLLEFIADGYSFEVSNHSAWLIRNALEALKIDPTMIDTFQIKIKTLLDKLKDSTKDTHKDSCQFLTELSEDFEEYQERFEEWLREECNDSEKIETKEITCP